MRITMHLFCCGSRKVNFGHEACSEIPMQPIACDRSVDSECQNPNVVKERGFPLVDHSCTTAGMWKRRRNGLDGHSTGNTVFLPPNIGRAVDSTTYKKKFGKSFEWNRSSPQPSPREVSQFGGNNGVDGGRLPSPQSSLGKMKPSGANGGLLAHLMAQGSSGLQVGSSGDGVNLHGSSSSLRNDSRSDDGHSRDGSNRMSGGSSGNGSYHSGGSQQSDGCLNRLSGQSYESVASGISSSRQSCHSSSSSQGSLDHLEESGYSSTVNVHELLQQGLSDTDILRTWLSSLHLEELTGLFVNAGYDMPTITRMTPEDLTAIGITKPSMRKKLKSEICKLNISDGIPDYRPKDLSDWLSSLHLTEYQVTLVKQGFGTLDSVTDITWEDLEEIGIKKLGHQKKMMLAIDRLKRINTLLHRLSGSSHSSTEGLNQCDSLVSGGRLLSRISSSMASTSSSSPSVVSASSQLQAIPIENSIPWKTNTRDNCGILNERISVGSKGQLASVEIHPVPLNKLSADFPLVDRNTYPELPASSSKNDPTNRMPVGDATDFVRSNGGLEGDATPTNERKLLCNIDNNKVCVRTNYCSQEESMNSHSADQQNMRSNVLSSCSTLPNKICGKRKVIDLGDSCNPESSGFLNHKNVFSSKKANCSQSPSLSVTKEVLQPVCNRLKKEPPPPPKRSDSFKSSVLTASLGSRDRMQMPSQNSSASSRVFSDFSCETSGNLGSIFTSNRIDAENNAVANSSTHPGATRTSTSSSFCENSNAVEIQFNANPKQQSYSKAVDEPENLQCDDWQDGRLSEVSYDSDSGLESRHSISSTSLESSGSGGGIDSNTLPFANENVGTIKQRNPTSKPSILTSMNGDGNELNKSLFENEAESKRGKIQANNEKVDNVNTQSSQFTLVNGEIISEVVISNGNLPYGANADEVFDDIDGILNGLTQELDEMLKFHG